MRAADVEPTLDALVAGLSPQHVGLLTAHVDGELAGWLALTRPRSRIAGHWGSVTRVQTAPAFRGTGVGTLLMTEVARCAADDWGLDHLVLTVRGGTGTERFYERLGWREHGRHPRALRLGPDDLRDEIQLWLPLSGDGPSSPP
ncbi:GNAT family N-acetyltransferase [Kineococcus rubinsiae]|uniref:GNAT family N-acetyltransferase n=1 Tax=Kineococcus rubinsiae TaxID=2609562 RepID=UPI0027E576B5|nr:GNAT family N-acetyltransferase [Kineococcus rubinsiae]